MEWLKNLLGEELFGEVSKKLGGKKLLPDDGSFIPKHRLDEVIAQRDAYKTQSEEAAGRISELEKAAQDSEALKAQLEELNRGKEAAESRLAAVSAESAVRVAALKRGAKDPDDVLAFADLSGIVDGSVSAEDVVGEILQKKPYLFGWDIAQSGANPASPGAADTIARQFGKGLKGEII